MVANKPSQSSPTFKYTTTQPARVAFQRSAYPFGFPNAVDHLRRQLTTVCTAGDGRRTICPSLICNAWATTTPAMEARRRRAKAVRPSIGRADETRMAAISALQLARAATHTHKLIIRHAAALICGPHLISFLVSKLLYDLCLTHTHTEPGGCSTARFNLTACSLKYTQEKISAGGEKGRLVVSRMSLTGTNSSIHIQTVVYLSAFDV